MSRLKEIENHWNAGYWTSETGEQDTLREDVNFLIAEVKRQTNLNEAFRSELRDYGKTVARLRSDIGDLNERLEAAQANLEYNRTQLRVAEEALKQYSDKENWNPVQVSCEGVVGGQFETWRGPAMGRDTACRYFKNKEKDEH